MTKEGYAPFNLYPYNPAKPPAFAFLGMFGVIAVAHLVMMIPYRSFFPLPLIIGCGMEAAAYYFRSQSHDNIRQTLPFLLQNLLLLAAPPFLAASFYMSPRRIARVLGSEDLIPSPRLLTKLFVLIDITCFATQVAGAIMSGSEDATQASQGKTTIMIGLILQVVAFSFFAVWTASFQKRMVSSPPPEAPLNELKWQRYLYGLYTGSLLFIIRNITRIIEYNQGSEGQIQSNEAYLYVLDGCIMLAIVVVLLVLHPGQLRYKARHALKAGHLKDSQIPLV
ncbi:hypothetical protein SLS58_007788 [Diplodia intermedia]|uniref:RTA1 like protein n=1 Tax=Diplodia intermedia TaxID=856260 RepID=A0ABR3TJJ5_9PEZI